MTVIRPNSVSGITSITAQANEINVFRSNGLLAGLNLNGVNFNTTAGISTLAALKVTGNLDVEGVLTYQDVTNVDSLGIGTFRTGINVSGGQLDVGSNIKLGNAGVITATSFVGSGANLTSLPSQISFNNASADRILTSNGGTSVNAEANLTMTGNVLQFNCTANTHGMRFVATGDHYNTISFDSNRSSADAFLNVIDFKWNGTKVADIVSVSGSDTTNKDDGNLVFRTSPAQGSIAERLRITQDGKLLVAGADSYHGDADDLVLKERSGSNVGMTFQNTGTGYGVIYFADNSSTTVGRIQYDHTNDSLDLFAGGQEVLSMNLDGLVTGGQPNPSSSDNGNIYIKNGSSIGGVNHAVNYVSNAVFNGAWKYINSGTGATRIVVNQNGFQFDTAGSGTAGNNITFNTELRINTDGVVLQRGGISATPSLEIFGSGNTGDATADNLRFHNWGDSNGDYWQIGVNATLDANGNNAKPSTSVKGAAIRLNGKNGKVTLITSPSSTSTQYEGLTQNENGIVTIPHQPAFRSYTTSDGNGNGTVSGIWNTGSNDTRKFDNNDDFNESNGRFTAPVDGVYQISVAWDENNTSTIIDVQINGGSVNLYSTETMSAGSGWNSWFTSSITKLSSGDYVTINLRNTSGSYPFHQAGGRWGHFSVYLIG